MSTQPKNQNTSSILGQLDISGIQQEGGLQQELNKVKEQLENAKDELKRKDYLLQTHKKTIDMAEQKYTAVKTRSQRQEERLKILENQLKTKRQQLQKGLGPGQNLAQLERYKATQHDLRQKMSEIQKELLVERKKVQDLSSSSEKLQNEVKNLKNQNLRLQQCQIQQVGQNSTNDQHSRQLQNLNLQLEQEKSKYKKLEKQVENSNKRIQELLKLNQTLEEAQKKATTKVVQMSPNIIEVQSKQTLSLLRKREEEINVLKSQNARTKKVYEKDNQSLKEQLREERNKNEKLRSKLLLNDQQKSKLRISQGQQDEYLPSFINQQSKIQKKIKDIDAEELDDNSAIKVTYLHRQLVESLNKHVKTIPSHQKISFLSILTSWSEEQQERIETSVNDLQQG